MTCTKSEFFGRPLPGEAIAALNFADADLEDWAEAYYGPNLERLVQVKGRYDPMNAFRFGQSMPRP